MKKLPKEEKERRAKEREEKKIKDREIKEQEQEEIINGIITYDEIKTEMVEKEYKDNIQQYVEKRLEELKENLQNNDKRKALNTIELNNIMRGGNTYGKNVKYSVDELAILFEYYRKFVTEINTKVKYVPTKPSFCGFIGITTKKFNEYSQDSDENRRNIMHFIEDYLVDIQLSMAQNREIDTIVTMFRTKTEHGMVEASAPMLIKTEHSIDLEQIQRQIKTLSSGKSLKTIEMDKKSYKVE